MAPSPYALGRLPDTRRTRFRDVCLANMHKHFPAWMGVIPLPKTLSSPLLPQSRMIACGDYPRDFRPNPTTSLLDFAARTCPCKEDAPHRGDMITMRSARIHSLPLPLVGGLYIVLHVLLDWASFVHPFGAFGITP